MHEAALDSPSYLKTSEASGQVYNDQAIRFLDFIFQGITQGYIEFRFLSSGRRSKVIGKPLFFALPVDQLRLSEQILCQNNGQMITVGPAPRFRIPHGNKVGKGHDVLQANCLWADLTYNSIEGDAIEVNRRLRDFPLRPSITVNTGFGRQVYFALNHPLSDGHLVDWDNLIKGLRDTLGGAETINLAQTFLLPGSFNQQNAISCRLDEEDSSWVRYSFEELKDAVWKACKLRKAMHPRSQRGVAKLLISLATLQERGVPPDVLNAISTGHLSHSGKGAFLESRDYQERDLWVAKSLLEHGFDNEEVKSVFRSNPGGCGRKFASEKQGEQYLEFTVRTASALLRRQGEQYDRGDECEEHNDLPVGYMLDVDGALWFIPPFTGNERKKTKQVKVSNSYIGISKIREHIDSGQISLDIVYKYLGRPRTKAILRSQMSNTRQLVAALAGEGAPVTSNNARHVITYLAAYEHAFGANLPQKKVTSQFGRSRSGGPFFLPGVEDADVEFAPSGDGDASLYRAYASRRGSLRGWLDLTRSLAEEALMIPQVAILACFVPPLQSKLQIPNFILDINGSSSTGKSTSLKLAASVYGRFIDPDSMVMQWMNTRVAVEQLAGMCHELPIFLDDAQHCPDELKRSVVYMIANGRGKGRASRNGGISEILNWHTVALSTSEVPLHECSPHEGARGRILPIGGSTHPFPSGASSLVRSLEAAANLNHGHAGETYIRHLNNWTNAEWSGWNRRYAAIRAELLKSSTSNLVDRVSDYIAAIQLAAEIACPLLGLSFRPGVVGSWLMLHLIEEQSRHNLVLIALRALADFYVANINHFAGDGQYAREKPMAIYGAARKHTYVGFLRSTIEKVFNQHKWNQTALLNKMAEAGVIHATEGDRHTKKVLIEGVQHRMICIKWFALLPHDDVSLKHIHPSCKDHRWT